MSRFGAKTDDGGKVIAGYDIPESCFFVQKWTAEQDQETESPEYDYGCLSEEEFVDFCVGLDLEDAFIDKVLARGAEYKTKNEVDRDIVLGVM